jgi:hypothetical protein
MLTTYVYKPLEHMQYPDLLVQHSYETLATYYETSETLETYACNMRFEQNLAHGEHAERDPA